MFVNRLCHSLAAASTALVRGSVTAVFEWIMKFRFLYGNLQEPVHWLMTDRIVTRGSRNSSPTNSRLFQKQMEQHWYLKGAFSGDIGYFEGKLCINVPSRHGGGSKAFLRVEFGRTEEPDDE